MNIKPLSLHQKDGISLVNGTQISTAIAIKTLYNSNIILDNASNTTNVFYTGISPGTLDPAYSPNNISWSTSINVSGSSTSATVTYYTATIYMVASTVASGATTGNILTIDPANNIYLDGDNTCRTRIYA